ncbi:MAG: ABC transporter permease [Bacteroidetes bacterium]|nr:ABC transporter permease [Bacteroidota bacterium]
MSSTTIAAPSAPAQLKQMTIPSQGAVFAALLRADLTTQWRNRRSSLLVLLVPIIILTTWGWTIKIFGPTFAIANSITVGLMANGLMGYSNSIARDRDKGIFQRLRVAPASNWAIMASRLTVQLIMIVIMTLAIFLVAYQVHHITMTAGGYALALLVSIVCGVVYLSLGQVIVGLVKNPETVNATSRFVYIIFIMVGMFGEFGALKKWDWFVHWSPYGAVKRVIDGGLTPSTWTSETTMYLVATLIYSAIFSFFGIRWFRWTTR